MNINFPFNVNIRRRADVLVKQQETGLTRHPETPTNPEDTFELSLTIHTSSNHLRPPFDVTGDQRLQCGERACVLSQRDSDCCDTTDSEKCPTTTDVTPSVTLLQLDLPAKA
ncbi:hypothetical protein CDAR_412981 [Caerostris darwini]|uniref:Uncharacterized protein n=1 Tax=Caerostris darwini TaxID=1538125 RepID=A0AAV4PQD9_9ARAC|nr:hypothetical protein CDAR_412981 [Caerostris darwini]